MQGEYIEYIASLLLTVKNITYTDIGQTETIQESIDILLVSYVYPNDPQH